SRIEASQLPIPAVAIAISTSCGPGVGTGTSCSVRAEGGPNRSMAAAFMLAGIAGGDPAVARDTRRRVMNTLRLFGGVVEASSSHRCCERHRIPIFAIVSDETVQKRTRRCAYVSVWRWCPVPEGEKADLFHAGSLSEFVQCGEHVVGQAESGGCHVLSKMHHRRRASDKENIWCASKQPGNGNLRGCRAEPLRHVGQGGRLELRKAAAEWKERDVRDSIMSQDVNQRIVGSICQVVLVLDA